MQFTKFLLKQKSIYGVRIYMYEIIMPLLAGLYIYLLEKAHSTELAKTYSIIGFIFLSSILRKWAENGRQQ